MELTREAMRADLILRGYLRADVGMIAVAQREGDDGLGNYYRVIAYQAVPNGSGYSAYMRRDDCSVTWKQHLPDNVTNYGFRSRLLDWDEKIAVEQEKYLPPLYRFIMELEQCEHGTIMSPDGKPQSRPMRCMNCGKLVY